jgi:hypothetical protein
MGKINVPNQKKSNLGINDQDDSLGNHKYSNNLGASLYIYAKVGDKREKCANKRPLVAIKRFHVTGHLLFQST